MVRCCGANHECCLLSCGAALAAQLLPVAPWLPSSRC